MSSKLPMSGSPLGPGGNGRQFLWRILYNIQVIKKVRHVRRINMALVRLSSKRRTWAASPLPLLVLSLNSSLKLPFIAPLPIGFYIPSVIVYGLLYQTYIDILNTGKGKIDVQKTNETATPAGTK